MKKTTLFIALITLSILLAGCGKPEPRQLTDFGQQPVWSPDGSMIAFLSSRDGDMEIFTMKADGSDIVQLTSNSSDDLSFSWSPDGKLLAYTAYSSGRTSADIFTIGSDGSNNHLLRTDAAAPSWSPDGKLIAFSSHSGGGLYLIQPDGSSETMLLQDARLPVWSPDGTMIAFRRVALGASSKGYDVQKILALHLSTGEEEPICGSPKSYSCYNAVWSPDSKSVAYSSSDLSNGQHSIKIGYINSTKTEDVLKFQLPSTNNLINTTWSPDGKLIAFDYSRNDQLVINGEKRRTHDIYTVRTDGSKLSQLTEDTYLRFYFPAWSPDGKMIAFNDMKGEDAGIYLIQVK